MDSDDLGDGDWMSISSDEGKCKVVHVHESSAKRTGSKAKKENKLFAEEMKAVRLENGKVSKTCKKHETKLEPLLKICVKLSRSSHATQQFKDETTAAKDILKQCKKVQEAFKNKTTDKLSFEHDDSVVTELMASLGKQLKCIETLKSLTEGGMKAEDIENIVQAAKEKKKSAEAAVDVS